MTDPPSLIKTLRLPHGELRLPLFLPDATQGVVRAVDSADLEQCGVQAVVMNAFHLMQRPGHDLHFQTMLWMLAPDEWHWEATYKPREYDRAVKALGQNGMSSSSCGLMSATRMSHTSRACQPSQRKA